MRLFYLGFFLLRFRTFLFAVGNIQMVVYLEFGEPDTLYGVLLYIHFSENGKKMFFHCRKIKKKTISALARVCKCNF